MGKQAKNRKKKVSKQKKKKFTRLNYTKETLNLALEEVKKGHSVFATANKYNIPESTLRAKKENKYADKKPGPATVLTMTEENDLVDWIFNCSRKGFPLTKDQVYESVKYFCKKVGRKNSFVDDKPGRSWYESFLKRHPQISERVSENVCTNRAKVTEEDIRTWFDEIAQYQTAESLTSITEPERIFNCDETGNNHKNIIIICYNIDVDSKTFAYLILFQYLYNFFNFL